MTVRRGDIVLLPVALTSGGGVKLRLALVVRSDHNNVRLNDTIIAIITTTTHRAIRESTPVGKPFAVTPKPRLA
jgi:mRNA-degrading endonuclease toxin of MazEF toxin-antitoxin module